MSYVVKLLPEAEDTFDELIEQLQQRWGSKFVQKFENRVLKCLSIISQNPHFYAVIEDRIEIRKCVLHKNCSLFYKVNENVVSIICFWDNRQDPIIIG